MSRNSNSEDRPDSPVRRAINQPERTKCSCCQASETVISTATDRPNLWPWSGLAFVVAVLPFLPALWGGFVGWDDPPNITDNLAMTAGMRGRIGEAEH